VCWKIRQFLSSIKKTCTKENWFFFSDSVVYIDADSVHWHGVQCAGAPRWDPCTARRCRPCALRTVAVGCQLWSSAPHVPALQPCAVHRPHRPQMWDTSHCIASTWQVLANVSDDLKDFLNILLLKRNSEYYFNNILHRLLRYFTFQSIFLLDEV